MPARRALGWKWDVVIYDRPGWSSFTYQYPLWGTIRKRKGEILVRFDSADEQGINDDPSSIAASTSTSRAAGSRRTSDARWERNSAKHHLSEEALTALADAGGDQVGTGLQVAVDAPVAPRNGVELRIHPSS
jgi:hypothetical protein